MDARVVNKIQVDYEESGPDEFSGMLSREEAAPQEHIPAWLGEAPGYKDEDAAESYECDVLVIGAGIAGVSAARAAAEAGAQVMVLEQSKRIAIRGKVFGCVDSHVHKEAGCETDKMDLLNLLMRRMGWRPNARLWKMWLDESGAAFDWFEEPALRTGLDFGRYLQGWPLPPKYDRSRELFPQYCSGIQFDDWDGVCKLHYMESVAKGAKYFFRTGGAELIKTEKGIMGAFAKTADGRILKFTARKGVVLATGDYGSNRDMVRELCPEFYNTLGLVGARGSTGMGHKMAIWAGAMMEEAPHAHISHSFPGAMVMGTTATLNLNANGDRYMNEDVPGQIFTNQIIRQPFKFGWQIYDANWMDMMDNQNIAHGAVDINRRGIPRIQETLKKVDAGEFKGNIFRGDTLEELVEKIGLPKERALESIRRYNELCEKGVDEDFGKRSDRMYALVQPPFYAAKSITSKGMITGGVVVDEECRVLEKGSWKPLGGLYAIGNVGGGRYACDYPVSPVCATSHGTAVTFGRHVGLALAASEAR